jgi:hypothetical protein
MAKKHFFSLQPSEAAVFRAAADIYASYIVAGQVTADNEAEMMKKAIGASISMARHVDSIIQSDDELSD